MRDLLPALAFAVMGSVALGAATLAPRDDAPVLVVFAPGTVPEDGLMRVIGAGWRPIATPGPGLVLADPDGAGTRRPPGAWVVLNAMGLRGCT